MKKKLIAVLLCAAMVVSLTACGGASSDNGGSDVNGTETAAGEETTSDNYMDYLLSLSYDDACWELYEDEMGDFYDAYQLSLEETDLSTRWALMAIAEAKFLEDDLFLPMTTNNGQYSMAKDAPYSYSSVLYGQDSYRYHSRIVTNEWVTAEDWEALKEAYSDYQGTGEWLDYEKQYLTDNGYTLDDQYTYYDSEYPNTWDVLSSSQTVDSEYVVNCYTGLLEYDAENVQQPAMAESYEKGENEDGQVTYTFHIRQGVNWVNSSGDVYGEVTADDWVAGFQHMLDCGTTGALCALVQGVIVGVNEYLNGEITDMDGVGVEATDDYTLVYTLEYDCPYFLTMFGYGVFAPMNRAYFISEGGAFGAEYDSTASSYTYGSGPDHILYNGAFICTGYAEGNAMTFTYNDEYWNPDDVNIHTITITYNDGSDATKAYNDFINTDQTYVVFSETTLELVQADGYFDEYCHTTDTDATTYGTFFNIFRQQYANADDETAMVSTMSDEDATRSNLAMQNVHFRHAISFSIDRGAYNAISVGEDLKYASLRNSYTPGNFVQLTSDVTVDINGTATTFAAGTYYGEIMQAQLDADGMPITAFDTETGSSDGYDGWYNVDNATAELETAISELAEEGIEITADNPIYLDFPVYNASANNVARGNLFKQNIEDNLGGLVIVNLVGADSTDAYYGTSYYVSIGSEMNFSVANTAGWGPDYGDPQTFLDTLLPDYDGYFTASFGLF